MNRTGGSGIIGHSALVTAKPDGYTIGTINVDLSQLVCKGLTDLSSDKFTQIALINTAPAGLEVNADSPFKTAQELLDAIKKAIYSHRVKTIDAFLETRKKKW